ncbi:MAG: hypothetical protein NE328_11905 [Lentisphaeraceae bacterium]|nr:hypothetical protein [Lentisphaeraceae bacterium]
MKKVKVKINGRDLEVEENQDYKSLVKIAGKDHGCQVLYKSKIPCDHCGMRKAGNLFQDEDLTVTEGMSFNILRC